MRLVGLLVLLVFISCGDDTPIDRQVPPADTEVTEAAAELPQGTGVVHEVRMVGSIEGGFSFDPQNLVIKPGDTVLWTNVSGFPHNVAFHADRIPQGAGEVLDAVMPAEGKLGPMNGRVVSEAGGTFEMEFLNAPYGTYHYFSVPQEAMGMEGTITVEMP